MTPEIKIRDLKKLKQDNALNFLFLVDQKLKKNTENAPAENQVNVISNTKNA